MLLHVYQHFVLYVIACCQCDDVAYCFVAYVTYHQSVIAVPKGC